MEITVDTNDLLSHAESHQRMLCHCSHLICMYPCIKRDENIKRITFWMDFENANKDAPKSKCATEFGHHERSRIDWCECEVLLWSQQRNQLIGFYICTTTQSPYFASCSCKSYFSNSLYAPFDGMCELETGQSTARRSTCTMPYLKQTVVSHHHKWKEETKKVLWLLFFSF